MKIHFSKIDRQYPLNNRNLLLRIIRFIVKTSPLQKLFPVMNHHLNIIFVNDKKIQEINESYLKHEGPTDVISFDYSENLQNKNEGDHVVGEIFISLDTAARQAKEYKMLFHEEVILYMIHGVLHLCGFDDHKEEDIKEMRQQEANLMSLTKNKFGKLNFF